MNLGGIKGDGLKIGTILSKILSSLGVCVVLPLDVDFINENGVGANLILHSQNSLSTNPGSLKMYLWNIGEKQLAAVYYYGIYSHTSLSHI